MIGQLEEASILDERGARQLAELWTRHLDGDASVDEAVKQSVVLMNFTASPAVQWAFICAAVSKAKTDETLGHIAAGPIEHLLGKHGDEYIGHVETEANREPKFSRMMTGVWRHMMNDAVWARVETIKATAVASGNTL
jgi:hypothetical protein